MKHTRKTRNKNPKPVKNEKPKLKLVPHPFERFMKINAPANANTNYGNIYRMNTRIPRRRAS